MTMGSLHEKHTATHLMGFCLNVYPMTDKRGNLFADSLSRSFETMNASELMQ